ncbi:MAG TPA: heparan-alpha-glucosaminide N-acetyltransferase domain-containing protein [Mucilaginibacter sp.]|jgi:uncharacterized membrane protein
MPNLAEPSGKQRIQSIDILRGVIMLIMALDHVRDFVHNGFSGDPTDMATTTPILFITRWITHFCAPTFVFLSGTSAYLAGLRRTKSELSAFLIKRGLWLIFVELAIITLAFTFNPFYNLFILQVIWAIGFSMVILGLLVRAPLVVIGVIGALILFGHDMLDNAKNLPTSGTEYVLLRLFLTAQATVMPINANHFVFDLYAILPWTGIMLLGYVFGSLYKPSVDSQKRKKILLYTGLAVLALFFVFRLFNLYGDPAPWSTQRDSVYTVLSYFNVSKYPPSLMYSCMTIGAALVVLSQTEKIQNKLTKIFTVYGSVPFFYYVLHFYLIHIITVILFFASGYTTSQIIDPKSPFLFRPATFGYGLGIVYLVWLFVIIVLYFPCRWFSKYKKSHSQWWLSYL